jgi:hypothetical protein
MRGTVAKQIHKIASNIIQRKDLEEGYRRLIPPTPPRCKENFYARLCALTKNERFALLKKRKHLTGVTFNQYKLQKSLHRLISRHTRSRAKTLSKQQGAF